MRARSQAHSNNTRPPASVRISVTRADFPYRLQCRSASACTALALVANHLSTRALALLWGGGDAAHAESASAVATMMRGLKVMTHLPVGFEVSARPVSWYALHTRMPLRWWTGGPGRNGVPGRVIWTTAETRALCPICRWISVHNLRKAEGTAR